MPRRNPIAALGQPSSATQYRFWGSQRPPVGRQPVRASISGTIDGDVATIRIYSPIDSWGGDWGVSALEFAEALDQIPDVGQIQLRLNSPGGEVWEGVAILNLLRQHPANVTAHVDGIAASAASFLACGVDEAVMGENSQLMIHDAWGICIGPAQDMAEYSEFLNKMSDNIASVYSSKAGTGTDWRAAMLAETWYDANEAVAIGLADSVDGAAAADPAGAFDLSIFKHQGRADAPAPPLPADRTRPTPPARSALQQRRHRMNARRHALPLPER